MKRSIPHLLLAATVLSGCVTNQTGQAGQEGPNKQTFGAILGGIAGALLGSQVGSGKGQLAAVAAGALAGAWIGSEIGASLDRADRLAIEQHSARALASAQDGQTLNWKNPNSGVSASLTPVNSRVETRQVVIVRNKRVMSPSLLILIGETYEARKNVNVRAEPSTGSKIVGLLQTGEQFHAVGKVQGSSWILAAIGNRSIGYVFEPLVRAAASGRTPQLRQVAINLDEINLDQNVVAEHVMAETKCRTITRTINTKDGQSATENFDACQGYDGNWEVL